MGFAKNEAEIAERVRLFIKADLERLEWTHERLAKEMKRHGHPNESAESIKQKLKRGTFSATFFLAAIAALGHEHVALDEI